MKSTKLGWFACPEPLVGVASGARLALPRRGVSTACVRACRRVYGSVCWSAVMW